MNTFFLHTYIDKIRIEKETRKNRKKTHNKKMSDFTREKKLIISIFSNTQFFFIDVIVKKKPNDFFF